MLKKETLDLLPANSPTFEDVFSVCIGKTFLFQDRFVKYLNKYERWSTNVKEGTLKLGSRSFHVEYIGTTSNTDPFWYSSELEHMIPAEYTALMASARKNLEAFSLNELAQGKIRLDGNVNGYNLSMIYIAFAPENAAYFCGAGNVTIYMFVKDLPEELFRKMDSTEFTFRIPEIISTFDVNHKLMVKALLTENEIGYEETPDAVIAKFNDRSAITVAFDDAGRISGISGNMSL